MNPDSSEVSGSCAGSLVSATENGACNLHHYIPVDMFILHVSK